MMLKVRNGAARSAATQPVEKTEYPIVPPPKPQRHNSQHLAHGGKTSGNLLELVDAGVQ